LGCFYQMSEQCGNMFGCYPASQNFTGFLYGCGKE
jgi:hypothetical protein